MWQSEPNAADRASSAVGHGHLEVVKWIAIITMTIDHYGKIVDPSVYFETNAIGRITFPLFAWIIGERLAINPSLGRKYLSNLIPWALFSQVVYVFVGKDWSDPNIFFTLSLGVAAHCALRMWLHGARHVGISLLFALLCFAVFVEYGVVGVVIMPLVARVSRVRPFWGAALIGPLGVLSNLSVFSPYVGPGALWALASSVIALSCLRHETRIPRLPKQAFYAYYPFSLLALYAFAHA